MLPLIAALIAKFGSLNAVLLTLKATMVAHPLFALALIITGLVSGLNVMINEFDKMNTSAKESMEGVKQSIDGVSSSLATVRDEQLELTRENKTLENLRDEYIELSSKTEKTAEDQQKLNDLYAKLSEIIPGFNASLGETSEQYKTQSEVIDDVNKKIEENIELIHARAKAAAQENSQRIGEISDKMQETDKKIKGNQYSKESVYAYAESMVDTLYTKDETGNYYRKGQGGNLKFEDILRDMVISRITQAGDTNTKDYIAAVEQMMTENSGEVYKYGENLTKEMLDEYVAGLIRQFTGGLELDDLYQEAWDKYAATLEDEAQYRGLQGDLDSLIGSLLDTYTRDIRQLPGYLDDQRKQEINVIRNNLDMTADNGLESRVNEALSEIESVNDAYRQRYESMTDAERILSARLEQAYQAQKNGTGTREAYNEVVKEYNTWLESVGRGAASYLKEIEEEVTSAQSTGSGAGVGTDSAVKTKTVKEMQDAMDAVNIAFANGFTEQLHWLLEQSLDDTGNFNRENYNTALSNLRKQNEDIYATMMNAIPQLTYIKDGTDGYDNTEIAKAFFQKSGEGEIHKQIMASFNAWREEVDTFEKEIIAKQGNDNAIITFIASQFEIRDASAVKELIARTTGEARTIIKNAMESVGLTDIDSVFESETPKTDILKYVEGTVEKLQYEMERLADKRMTPSKLAEGFEELKRAMHMEDGSGLDKMVKAYAAMNETTKGKFLSNTGLTEEWFELLGKGAELTAEEIRNLNEELLKAEYAKVGNNWNTLATAVANLGKEANNTGSDISSVLDDLKDYGQARAGIEWLLANSDTADSETVAAVRKKVSSIIKVSEDYLKDNDQLNFFAQMFEEGEMSQVRKSIQNFYDLFRDMLNEGDYSIDLSAIDFTDSEAVINALDTIIQEAIDSEDRALADAAKTLRQFVLEGFVGLQEETATIMDQTLDMTALNEGSFDKINKSKTEYGKMLGLKELLTYASRSKEALAELADEWQRTEESTKKTYRNWIDSEIWDILDKRNITDADQSKFGALIGNINPEKLIEVNSELETLRSNLNNIEAYGAGSAKGLGALRDEIDQTKQGIAAFRAYTSENSSLKLKGAAKDALIQWLGIPETLFDSDAGMDAIEAEVVRRQES